MPYANGETPVPGDYVKNELQQPGPVTRVSVVPNGDEFVTIRFDRGLDSPLTRASYTLTQGDSGYGREKGTTLPDVPNLRLLFTR